MVLHLSGLAMYCGREELQELDLRPQLQREVGRQYHRDLHFQDRPALRPRHCEGSTTVQDERETPGFHQVGRIVLLQGSFDANTFGIEAQTIAFLPEGCRPLRTIRCLAPLLKRRPNQQEGADIDLELLAEEAVAVTIRPDGQIAVEGGNTHALDKKGTMRIVQQKKRGFIYLDGVRFILDSGIPIAAALDKEKKAPSRIFWEQDDSSGAVAFRQGSIVCLEGALRWSAENNTPHPRRALGRLPRGHWPERREVFFTRGHMFAEAERCRVDVDCHGRIFCPEGGAEHGHVNLSGIIFKAADTEPNREPQCEDWDELVVQYSAVKQVFDEGHKLLEDFIRRCNRKDREQRLQTDWLTIIIRKPKRRGGTRLCMYAYTYIWITTTTISAHVYTHS